MLTHCCHLQVKCVLVLHLISAAFATAALGLMSKHLPYRQDSYHCEHCRRLELHAVVLSLKPTRARALYEIHCVLVLVIKLWQNRSAACFSGSVADHVTSLIRIHSTSLNLQHELALIVIDWLK